MKTFRQWFDSLSPETQEYLTNECTWIDKTSDDRYKHPAIDETVIDSYVEYVKDRLLNDRYVDNERCDVVTLTLLFKNKDNMSRDQYLNTLLGLVKTYRHIMPLIDALDLKDIFKLKAQYKETYEKSDQSWNHNRDTDYVYLYPLCEFLLITDDFDNINWELLDKNRLSLSTPIIEILGKDEVKKIAKKNPERMIDRMTHDDINNAVFDELFFCEDGWTKEQKLSIINRYRMNENDIKVFMSRIVAVDESYLRYIGTYFIDNYPALGMHLYKLKKTKEELDALPAGHKIEDEYQYPKAYRKLFQIAACCARKNVGKAMAGTIGDIAGILKMYGYNFNMIFDCLYPQYAETNKTDESNTVTV